MEYKKLKKEKNILWKLARKKELEEKYKPEFSVEKIDLNSLKEKWKNGKSLSKLLLVYYNIKRFIIDLPFNMKMFFQRLFRGYSDSDIWNLDDTITNFILPRLKAFRNMKRYSIPCSLEDDYKVVKKINIEPIVIKQEKLSQLDKDSEIWDEILDKMIWAFEYHDKDNQGSDDPNFSYFDKDWNYNKEKHLELEKRFNEGLLLFCKYYGNLWD